MMGLAKAATEDMVREASAGSRGWFYEAAKTLRWLATRLTATGADRPESVNGNAADSTTASSDNEADCKAADGQRGNT